jgi:glucose/arabinose dehydrogenase
MNHQFEQCYPLSIKVDPIGKHLFQPQSDHFMNRLPVFAAIFPVAFLLFGPEQTFGQTQLVSAKITVPAAFRSNPFGHDQYLLVPRGFQIRVVNRIAGARFLRSTPDGGLLVSQPSSGKIWWLSVTSADATLPVVAASGLRLPHGMVFTVIEGKTYLYVSESNEISRFLYDSARHALFHKEVVVANLPDTSSPELRGSYRHELKNLTIGPDQHLYVDIASSTNADPRDTISDPIRCAIYRYDLDGGNRTLFAKGIRNAEGLDFTPGTTSLWAVVNGSDDIRFPYHRSWKGAGSDDYGKRITGYIDDHPPDTLIHVKLGADYGWPFAEPNPDSPSGLDNMPLDPYYDNNPDWNKYPESKFTRSDKGIQAHSAPLGMAFLQETKLPEWLRNSAAVAYHGSWDRSRKTGYKVVIFPWTSQQRPGDQTDLVTGWLDDQSQRVWGRPVDVKPSTDGKSLFISDDYSGTIYELRPER